MSVRVHPEVLIARQEVVAAPARPADELDVMRLLPLLVFTFGMIFAAIPMMLG